MSPTNANPASGYGGAHGISKSDAASPSRNQILAQSNPAARSAAFILAEATALGICVATDGVELIALVPVNVSTEAREELYRRLYEFKEPIINLILQKAVEAVHEFVPDAVEGGQS
jgi:hypothetical protein